MADASEEEASHSNVDHGLGDVEALLVVAHQPTPSGEPTEGPLDHPAARQYLEAGLAVDAADNLDDEVEEGGFVHELCPVVGAVCEQMFDPWPALAEGVEDQLGAGAIGKIGRRQIDHQQASIGVDDNVPLAADRLLGSVIAALRPRGRRLYRLAVEHSSAGAGFSTGPLAVNHQGDVVDRAEQHEPHEAPEPPIDRLPGRKVLRQHPPAAARTGHVADSVQHLPHVHLRLAPPFRRLRQQGSDPFPFLVGEIGRIALGLPLDRGHAASRLSCPHV